VLLRYPRGWRTDVLVPGQAPAGQGSRRRGRPVFRWSCATSWCVPRLS